MNDIEICPICKKPYSKGNRRVMYHLRYKPTPEFIYACKSCNHAEYLARHGAKELSKWQQYKIWLVNRFSRDYYKFRKQ